jgi:hypothetical protein
MRVACSSFVVFGVVWTMGCASAAPPADGPPADGADPPGACTSLGCESGFRLETSQVTGDGPSPRPWPHGAYRVTASVDGQEAVCEGELPLPSCDAGPALRCTGAPMTVEESGCALDPAEHGFGALRFGDTGVKTVDVRVERDGVVVARGSFAPVYRTLQPNGPRCEPTCESAEDTLEVR